MDFSLIIYRSLLETMMYKGFHFITYKDFNTQLNKSFIVLRHDVDTRKENSLYFAQIQAKLNIYGTYYFRNVPQSFDESIIRQIAQMGHEIGYHYENMDTCKGNVDKAYDDFCRKLEKFRKIVPITTICMHGSPLSKYDNRAIWEKNDYRKLGILAEPYFDLDFNKVFYLTDTGRRWDGDRFSVRDKAVSPQSTVSNPPTRHTFPSYHSTNDIIKAIQENSFPTPAMMTFHPQRWTDNKLLWTKELVSQNVKNVAKHALIKLRK